MSSEESYYSSGYEFNPYDSDTYPDAEDFILDDESQMFHRDQLNEGRPSSADLPLPQVTIPDPAVAVCHSLDQSKRLIQERFDVNPAILRYRDVTGIVIIPLKDINLIRKDYRSNREFHHILIIPAGENFNIIHPDFAQAIQTLHQ